MGTVEYCGYTIQSKADFGRNQQFIDGERIEMVFVVTKGGVSVMPGATWFRTVDDAMDGIAAGGGSAHAGGETP